MSNLYELHSYLCDCVLENPKEDGWKSFIAASKTFLDCWEPYEQVTVLFADHKLIISAGNTTISFDPVEEGFLKILYLVDAKVKLSPVEPVPVPVIAYTDSDVFPNYF